MADGTEFVCSTFSLLFLWVSSNSMNFWFLENTSNLLILIFDANPVWWGRVAAKNQEEQVECVSKG